MIDKQETVADIVLEMRDFARYAKSESNDCRYVAYYTYEKFPKRIEAAYKREIVRATRRNEDTFGAIVEKCDNLEAENAKLREALKPIMEVNGDFKIYDAILGLETYKLFALKDAVRKAQDVINGISRKDENISRKGGME